MKDPKFWMKKEEDDGSELKLHDFYIVDFVFNVNCNVLGHKHWNLSPVKGIMVKEGIAFLRL